MTDAKIIAIEEHFTSPHLRKLIAPREGHVQTMLDTMEGVRFKDMDEAGVDYMILSENNPATQNLAPDIAVAAARQSNDFLHDFIGKHPKRFGGFATLPTPDPKAAADELERAVTRLGF